jgi:hypothetical protein
MMKKVIIETKAGEEAIETILSECLNAINELT